jgi:hypothetical protein
MGFPKLFKKHFLNILGLKCSESNLGSACENLGGLGPLVWEEIETEHTVLKLLYIDFHVINKQLTNNGDGSQKEKRKNRAQIIVHNIIST